MKLGILIPYYKNTEECEWAFKKLMITLEKQVGGNIYLNILEEWVKELQKFKGINQQGFSWGVAQEVLDKMKD